jgi:hypothetical protein
VEASLGIGRNNDPIFKITTKCLVRVWVSVPKH